MAIIGLAGPVLARPVFAIFFFFFYFFFLFLFCLRRKSVTYFCNKQLSLMHKSGSIDHHHESQRVTAAYIKYQMTHDFIFALAAAVTISSRFELCSSDTLPVSSVVQSTKVL